jgi:two-component system, sensor histidine kinase and response regulator
MRSHMPTDINTMIPWKFVLDENARILFVDDDVILAEFARVHLATPVTTVESAANGAEAWGRLCREPFDLVLLDIEMPVLDGFGLLEKLRAEVRFEHLPIVMLTGREDIVSIDRAFQLGANSFVTKPINWRALSYALRSVLRATRMEAEFFAERQRAEELRQLTKDLLSLIPFKARAPIRSINRLSNCISRQVDGPVSIDSYVGYAEQIGVAARQLQENLMDLIEYAQLSSGEAQLTHEEHLACGALDAAVESLALDAARGATVIAVKKPRDDFYLLCDRRWLTRVLCHFLEQARGDDAVKTIEFGLDRSINGDAVFSVVTYGDASPDGKPAASAQGFGATAPLGDLGEGRRLGMAFARRIVELHGGKILARVRDDGGAIFEVILPAWRVTERTSCPPQVEDASAADRASLNAQ